MEANSWQTKTTQCKACGHVLSKTARICPNCGHKPKKPIYTRGWFILVMIVLVIIAVPDFGDSGSKNSDAAISSSTARPTARPTAKPMLLV